MVVTSKCEAYRSSDLEGNEFCVIRPKQTLVG